MGFVPPVCFKKQLDRSLETPNAPWEVVATFWDNLHVLAVDPSRPKDGTLVAHAFKSAVRQLLGHPYAYIVVDCPPVLGSADVNIISEAVDGLLFTTLSGRSRTSDLRQAEEHLRPAHVLGTVLVGAI
jgi:Mrp family chromosome partitioning ATPase